MFVAEKLALKPTITPQHVIHDFGVQSPSLPLGALLSLIPCQPEPARLTSAVRCRYLQTGMSGTRVCPRLRSRSLDAQRRPKQSGDSPTTRSKRSKRCLLVLMSELVCALACPFATVLGGEMEMCGSFIKLAIQQPATNWGVSSEHRLCFSATDAALFRIFGCSLPPHQFGLLTAAAVSPLLHLYLLSSTSFSSFPLMMAPCSSAQPRVSILVFYRLRDRGRSPLCGAFNCSGPSSHAIRFRPELSLGPASRIAGGHLGSQSLGS